MKFPCFMATNASVAPHLTIHYTGSWLRLDQPRTRNKTSFVVFRGYFSVNEYRVYQQYYS